MKDFRIENVLKMVLLTNMQSSQMALERKKSIHTQHMEDILKLIMN